jgi:hypothetical protein
LGYDVHIERMNGQSEAPSEPITLEEWIAFVKSDPEMRMTPVVEVANPRTGEVVRIQGDGLSVWTGRSAIDGQELHLTFRFSNGRISTRFPLGNDEGFRKLCSIARSFGGYIEGDGGERYDEGENQIVGTSGDIGNSTKAAWRNDLFPSNFGGGASE